MIRRLGKSWGCFLLFQPAIAYRLYLVAWVWSDWPGRLVAKFTKDDFDRASEDYIVLKTSLTRPGCQSSKGKLHYQLRKLINDKSYIVAQEQRLNDINRGSWSIQHSCQWYLLCSSQDLEKYFTDQSVGRKTMLCFFKQILPFLSSHTRLFGLPFIFYWRPWAQSLAKSYVQLIQKRCPALSVIIRLSSRVSL